MDSVGLMVGEDGETIREGVLLAHISADQGEYGGQAATYPQCPVLPARTYLFEASQFPEIVSP